MATAESPRARPRATPRWVPIAIALGALLLLGLGLWAYFSTRPETSVAVRRDIVAYLPVDGRVVVPPRAEEVLFSPFQTTVKDVHTSLGERVQRGELLVELTMPTAEMAVQQAQQAVENARAALAEQREQLDDPVEAAQQELEQARAAVKQARAAATPAPPAPAPTAPAPAAGAPGQAETPAPAAGPGPAAGPSPALQEAIRRRQAAEEALEQARRQLEEQLAPYQQALDRARRALQEAREGRTQGLIRAPISGTVIALNAKEGDKVGDNARVPLVRIVNLDQLQVHAPLTAEQVPHADRGTPVRIQFEKLPDQTFPGQIRYVTTAADQRGRATAYTAVVTFRNEDRSVMPDQEARVSIKLGEATNVVAVPADAVDRGDEGQPVVAVRRGGDWQEIEVVTGLSDGEFTEIKEGLREGETIRVTPDLL